MLTAFANSGICNTHWVAPPKYQSTSKNNVRFSIKHLYCLSQEWFSVNNNQDDHNTNRDRCLARDRPKSGMPHYLRCRHIQILILKTSASRFSQYWWMAHWICEEYHTFRHRWSPCHRQKTSLRHARLWIRFYYHREYIQLSTSLLQWTIQRNKNVLKTVLNSHSDIGKLSKQICMARSTCYDGFRSPFVSYRTE